MTVLVFIKLLGLGLGVGVLSAFFGVGGGAFLVPALIGLFGLDWQTANALSLTQMVPTSASGAWGHFKNRSVHARLAIWSLVGAVPGAWFGRWIVKQLGDLGNFQFMGREREVLDTVLTWLFIVMIIYMSRKTLKSKKGDAAATGEKPATSESRIEPMKAILLGLSVGIASAMLGIGGGFIYVPLSIQLFNMPVVLAVGTSLFQMPITAMTGAASYLQNTPIPWLWLIPLVMGSLSGVQLGVWLSKRFDNAQYKKIFAVMLLVIAAYLAGRWLLGIGGKNNHRDTEPRRASVVQNA